MWQDPRIHAVLKPALQLALARMGYEMRKVGRAAGYEDDFEHLVAELSPFTMVSRERLYACWQAGRYVATAGVGGDIVECGVWRGGATMMLASALMQVCDASRVVWLYDTFEGMAEPSERDVGEVTGLDARRRWEQVRQNDGTVDWCHAPVDDVRENLRRTGYPSELLRFIKGKVEETIPRDIPDRIAVLRLDTDWYESTKHELEHLFPRLVRGGVLLVDDYGCWRGAREAVDEYFREHDVGILLARTDYTGRLAIKTA